MFVIFNRLAATARQLDKGATLPRSASTVSRGFPLTERHFFLMVFSYFALHAVLRGMISETAGIDDVDQILRAQLWSWGYGPQPPLYTWLSRIFLSTFGFNTFSLALLKESVILSIYVLVYACARRLTNNDACGMAAAALLEFLPSIAWESHRELTHTVLASAMVLATIYTFLRLEPHRWTSYVLFGVCGGLGMLAKYNFAIVYVALLMAAFSVRQLRVVVFNVKLLVAILITLIVCAPHLGWLLQHGELALSSVHKLKIVEGAGWWRPAFMGLSRLVIVILAHVGLLAAVIALVFRRHASRLTNAEFPGAHLLWRMLGWTLCLVVVSMVVFRVTGPRDRYMQPLFVWLPILLIAGLQEQLTSRRLAFIMWLSAAVACGILIVAPGRILLTERLHKHEVLTMPFHKLAQDLEDAADKADCIIAEDHPLAGNLRLWFPQKLVVDPEVGPLFRPVPGKALLLWDADKSPAPPQELLRFASSFTGGQKLKELRTFEEPLKYHHQATLHWATGFAD